MKKLILVAPIMVIISVVAAIMLLLSDYWILGIFLLTLAFILNWWSETFAFHPFLSNNRRCDFRLLTYNINRAHEISVNKGTTEELIDFILAQSADIVLLQEYNSELYPLVQETLSQKYPYGSGIDVTSRFKSVFSRFPIESCEQLMIDSNIPEYESFQNRLYSKKQYNGLEILPICKMIIRIRDNRLQLFNCHLMSNNYSVVIRNLLKKRKSVIWGICQVLHRMDFGYRARDLQAKVILGQIESDIPTIVCGDFNDISGSTCIRRLNQMRMSDAWWNGGSGFGFTFHGMGLWFRLDHVMYQEKYLRLKKVFVPSLNVSDHNPLVCDLDFK